MSARAERYNLRTNLNSIPKDFGIGDDATIASSQTEDNPDLNSIPKEFGISGDENVETSQNDDIVISI